MGQYKANDPMWVIGCIDSYGAIIARHAHGGQNYMHTLAESKGKRWRWNIWGQEYHQTATLDRLTDEEYIAVDTWLERKGYKTPESP